VRLPGGQPAPRRLRLGPGCVPPLLVLLAGLGVTLIYLLAPFRTNLLVIGIDYVDPGSAVARSDTIMLTTFVPLKPYIGLLSIPRDLWVHIPGGGENRINTAHFYAESQQPGSGPAALQATIQENFGVKATYYVRIRFEGFREVVDALGGVDIVLTQPMAGYPAGKHHLTGRKALAFVRDRANSDDFFRMSQGQFMLRSLFKNLLNPLKWIRLPALVRAFFSSIDTNLPVWQWPRLGFALLRAGPDGIDNHVIGRKMVTPFITNEGANVLIPDWEQIRPLTRQIFGQ